MEDSLSKCVESIKGGQIVYLLTAHSCYLSIADQSIKCPASQVESPAASKEALKQRIQGEKTIETGGWYCA